MAATKRNAKEKMRRLENSRAMCPVASFANEMINIYFTENPRVILFSGDMIVVKVVRGENFDIIYGSFNIFPSKIREVIFANNHARKQLITVKRGQFVHIIGEGRVYHKEVEFIDRKTKQKRKVNTAYWQLFSYNNSGYYVPRMFDIKEFKKEVEDGQEIDYTEEMKQEEKEQFESMINDILDSNMNEIYYDEDKGNE